MPVSRAKDVRRRYQSRRAVETSRRTIVPPHSIQCYSNHYLSFGHVRESLITTASCCHIMLTIRQFVVQKTCYQHVCIEKWPNGSIRE
jgi:hypothetical protein